MDDKTVQRKLNQLTRIANELVTEAKTRYGDGQLFFEAEGTFHFMSGDEDGRADRSSDRQKHIVASSGGYCEMDSGAW